MGDGRRLPFTQATRFRKLADETKTAEWRRDERERERKREECMAVRGCIGVNLCLRKFT